MDFVLKFSSELLVIVLSLSAAGLNWYFFSSQKFVDQSLAGRLLSRHTQLNPKLYAANNSIITVVSHDNFLPQAQAESLTGLDSLSENAQNSSNTVADVFADDGSAILAPNPDSVGNLVAQEIKVYQTQKGDSLKSIAQKFGLNEQTIIWANKLPSQTIMPGWELIILPTDGIVHHMSSNDTLPDLANRYNPEKYNPNKQIRDAAQNKLLEKIYSFNALADAESFDEGQAIIIPGGEEVAAPAPKPVPLPKQSKVAKTPRDRSKVGGGGAVEEVMPEMSYDEAGHMFPKGYCTWYVAQKMGGRVKWGGNAKEWISNSKAYGAVVDRDPGVGTILVTNDSRRYGHVAYVEQVTDHSVVVSEMNYTHFGKVDRREIELDSHTIKGFIHP